MLLKPAHRSIANVNRQTAREEFYQLSARSVLCDGCAVLYDVVACCLPRWYFRWSFLLYSVMSWKNTNHSPTITNNPSILLKSRNQLPITNNLCISPLFHPWLTTSSLSPDLHSITITTDRYSYVYQRFCFLDTHGRYSTRPHCLVLWCQLSGDAMVPMTGSWTSFWWW
jgi:hypothetical protein